MTTTTTPTLENEKGGLGVGGWGWGAREREMRKRKTNERARVCMYGGNRVYRHARTSDVKMTYQFFICNAADAVARRIQKKVRETSSSHRRERKWLSEPQVNAAT
jgi:hypothetical protein